MTSNYKSKSRDDLEPEKAQKEPQETTLPVLTQAQLDLLQWRRLRSGNEVVVKKFMLVLKGKDLATLKDNNWLNDKVINFYMELIRERSVLKHDQGLPKVYVMNTFFLTSLLEKGYSGVKRWTQKVDLLAHDVIVVPVHIHNLHWSMAIIDLRQKTISYYDSLGIPNDMVLNALEMYLCEESEQHRRESPFDRQSFTKTNRADSPRQENRSDCGVFCCMVAEFLTRDHPLTFDQSNIQYFRQKMMVEIVSGQLLM